jgi:hypothetical protein
MLSITDFFKEHCVTDRPTRQYKSELDRYEAFSGDGVC